jgi:hypothetical protein
MEQGTGCFEPAALLQSDMPCGLTDVLLPHASHAALHEVCISDTCSDAQLCLAVMGATYVRDASSQAGKVSRLSDIPQHQFLTQKAHSCVHVRYIKQPGHTAAHEASSHLSDSGVFPYKVLYVTFSHATLCIPPAL